MKKQLKQLNKKLYQTNKTVQLFFQQTLKNYQSMKKKLKKIWTLAILFAIMPTTNACNVTRVMTTKSEYFQKGDTAISIMIRTTETYNAEKK